ncbi:hypothetical protein PR048_002835 [Dryococelus australis]|uniref:Uncharacterized protein n=1 Tax=Dryococelus australis TaxID=614101 RepID=A0ABQ9INK9_9NEOP|nr:hypothetical protein PR048_002835 [Dryococelus australis]
MMLCHSGNVAYRLHRPSTANTFRLMLSHNLLEWLRLWLMQAFDLFLHLGEVGVLTSIRPGANGTHTHSLSSKEVKTADAIKDPPAYQYLLASSRPCWHIFQSVTYPALQFMISKWAPPQERSRFSIIFSGNFCHGIVEICSGYSQYISY